MRLLYLSHGYTVHDRRFLTAFAEWDWEPLYARLDPGSALDARALPSGVTPVEWPSGAPDPDDLAAFVAPLQQLVAEHRPDVIYAGPIPTAGWIAAQSGHPSLAVMSWGSDILLDAEHDNAVRARAQAAISAATLAQSDCDAVSRRLRGTYGFAGEIVQFPWGVDLDAFAPRPVLRESLRRAGWADALVVISLRTWSHLHGVMTVMESFRVALEADPRLRLVLAGDGPLAEDVHAFIEGHGLQEHVWLPGRLSNDELPTRLNDADIYLACSRSDGSSISLLEAMASGLPAVVSDIEGNAEWIGPGEGGGRAGVDDPPAFATEIVALTADPNARVAAGIRNRAVALARADWARNIEELRAAIEPLVGH